MTDSKGSPVRHDEDTEAILRRRRFLIESAIAGLSAGALAAGCKEEPEPKVCLSIREFPDEPPTKNEAKPQMCLKIAPPKDSPKARPCLDVAPVPAPCLSLPAKETPPKHRPQACLSIDTSKE